VASVNTQTGAVVLTSADINGNDPTDSSVDTQDNINAHLFQYASAAGSTNDVITIKTLRY